MGLLVGLDNATSSRAVIRPAIGPYVHSIVGTAAAVIIGIAVGMPARLLFVLRSDFPLNDGGLFYSMVQDLQASHYALPAFATYNAAGIPFSYPPLGFYLAGILNSVVGVSLVDVFRFVPLVASILTAGVVALIAYSMFKSRLAAAVAASAFTLIPRSFEWMIMGGGITRSLGFLFAMLTLHQVYALCTRPSKRNVILASLFAGLTALSHLEMVWFVAYSTAFLVLCYRRNLRGVLDCLCVAAGAALVASPWWGTVIAQHGIEPFLAASGSRGIVSAGLVSIFLMGADYQIIGFVAALGILLELARGNLALPAWIICMFLLDPRSAQTTATVPIALLAGLAFAYIILPQLNSAAYSLASMATRFRTLHFPGVVKFIRAGLIIAIVVFVTSGAAISATLRDREILVGLSSDERAAMSWVAENTPPTSSFVVVSSVPWQTNRWSEWFPVLARRTSTANVQGFEWKADFERRITQDDSLQLCANKDATCLERWEAETGTSFTHVYLPKTDASHIWLLRDSLTSDVNYRLVYDGPGATIYERASLSTNR